MKENYEDVSWHAARACALFAGLCVLQVVREIRSGHSAEGWLLVCFTFVALLGVSAGASVPRDFKTERELRIARLNAQPSQRPGWSLEENRERVRAHLEREAYEQEQEELAEAYAQFSLCPAERVLHEPELVS